MTIQLKVLKKKTLNGKSESDEVEQVRLGRDKWFLQWVEVLLDSPTCQ